MYQASGWYFQIGSCDFLWMLIFQYYIFFRKLNQYREARYLA